MAYTAFHNYFPEVAEKETRTVTVVEDGAWGLPAGTYSLLEMYCDEPDCDCRRVFFYVVSSLRKNVEAVIAYGWENPKFYAKWFGDNDSDVIKKLKGPVLSTGSPQSNLAPSILRMVEETVLQDQAYIERIIAHYWMFKRYINTKSKCDKKSKKRKRK